MKASLKPSGIGGREVELHLEAESVLESIALRAWYAQRVEPVFGQGSQMPTRYVLLTMPFEFPAQVTQPK